MHQSQPDNAAVIQTTGEKAQAVIDDQIVLNDNGILNDYPNIFVRSCILLGVALSLFLVQFKFGLDMTIVATAIPRITDEFSGIDLVGWYGSAFFVTLAASQPVWGKAYQNFSMKYSFLLAIFIFELGSFISGIAPTSTVLIIGRAISGIGGAGVAAGGYAILSVIVEPYLRPIFTGLVTTTYSLANLLGPILGGVIAENTTWRWCFYINLPIGGASALVILLFFKMPDSIRPPNIALKKKVSQLDPIGAFLTLSSLCCLIRALQVAGITRPWKSTEVIVLLVFFAVLSFIFLVSQWWLQDRAMLVASLLRRRVVISGMAYGFFHEGSFFLVLYYLPIYFQAVSNLSPEAAGLRNLPLLLSCGVSSILSGWLVSRFRYYMPLMLLGSACGCVGSGLFFTLDANSPASHWIGYQVLAGFGYGLGLPLAIIASHAAAQPQELGPTTAMVLFAANIGIASAISIGQSVFDNIILKRLATTVLSIDPTSVITAGAAEFRSSFPPDTIPGIEEAYLYGLQAVFAICVAFAGSAVGAALLGGWKPMEIKK